MRTLQGAGVDARYERVESAAAMEEALRRQPWDAVISDFRMPGFTGLDALRILQATGIDIPFILISGAVGEETAVDAMKAGASDYVMKDNLARLAPALERELKDAAMRAENRRARRDLVESEERFRDLSATSSDLRLQASAALASSERRFAKAFRSSPLAVVVSRLEDGRVLDVNDAACQLFGRARQETVGRTTTELGFWVDSAERQPVVETLRRAGAVHGFEHRIRQKSGAIRVVQNWLELIELEGEACVVGSLLDVTEARRAAEALRERESQLRLITENIPAAVAYVDRDLLIQVANNRYVELHFGAGAEAIGRHVRDAVGETAWSAMVVTKRIAKVFAGESVVYERMLVRPDGERRNIEAHLEPDRAAGGGVRGYYAFALDITERKRAEEALRESDERFRATFEQAAVGVAHVATDGRWLRVNQKLCEIVGYTREELLARTFQDITHPDDLDAELPSMRRMLAGEISSNSMEKRYIRKDGGLVWINLTVALVRSDSGEPDYFIAVTEDISVRKRAEDALRESEARFRDLVSVSSDWYWEQDEHFRFVDMTATPSGSSPFRASDYAGKPRWEVHVDCLTPQQWAAHRRQVEAHELFRDLEYARPSQDGNTRWVSISGRPMFDENGRFRGYRGVGKDITERVQMQEQLRNLNAELEVRVVHRTTDLQDALSDLERFNSAVSHDLRGPARRMAAFAGLLREELGPKTGAEALRLLAIIEHNAEEMSLMVEQLLKLARLSHHSLDVGSVDMAALAREAWESLDESLPRQRVELRIGNLSVQRADRVLVKQVFINLLGNAVKFSAGCDRPQVEVGSRNQGGEEVYFVRDNGAGFDMAHVGKLFKPFSRLHGRNEFEGTGIGLSIVEQIARRHGGRVWAEAAPGQGATIYFTLGSAAVAVLAETQAAAPKAALTNRQSEVLALLASGCSTKEIAYRLGLSAKTVETHRARLIARLGIRSVAGLVRYALRHRLGVPDTRATQEGPR